MAHSVAYSLIQVFAVTVRLAVLMAPKAVAFLTKRREISTPMHSWQRLDEGLFLYRQGVSPYSGDMFHESPLMLWIFHHLERNWSGSIAAIFLFSDLVGAYFLRLATQRFLRDKVESTRNAKSGVYPSEVTEGDCSGIPILVSIMYLFNPYIVFTSTAWSTLAVHNCILAILFYLMVTGSPMCLLLLAVAAYGSLYPAILLPVYSLRAVQVSGQTINLPNFIKQLITDSIVFGISVLALLYASSLLMQSWEFLTGTYGFMLSVPDLSPNVGLFWYFFTEMFDHFRYFFLWVFQLNILIYVVPLAITLRNEPVLLWHQLVMFVAIFKAYPGVGDAGLYIALLPLWKFLWRYVRHSFLVCCTLVCCSLLAPAMWFLWIFAGSANANFYFAITLVYSTAQIFLLTDLLYAQKRRNLHAKHGLKPMINGQRAVVVLE